MLVYCQNQKICNHINLNINGRDYRVRKSQEISGLYDKPFKRLRPGFSQINVRLNGMVIADIILEVTIDSL